MTRLTHRIKKEYYPLVIERDNFRCFYCSEEFSNTRRPEWDHLNNNPLDSRLENLALCHHECNNKKKNLTDWQIKATKKMIQNERDVLASERIADSGTTEELTSSQAISKSVRPIALQWLEEHLMMENEILLRDAVPAIVNLCQNMIGWGSHAAVRRYIEVWSNPYNGKFTLSKNESYQTIILRRTGN